MWRLINVALTLLYVITASAQNARNTEAVPYPIAPPGEPEKEETFFTPTFMLLPGACYSNAKDEQLISLDLSLLWKVAYKSDLMLGAQASRIVWANLLNSDPTTRYELSSYSVGFRLSRRINRNGYFSLTPALVLGKESRMRNVAGIGSGWYILSEEKLFAPQISTGFFFPVPANKHGIYFGAEVFYRGATGTLLQKSTGFRFNFGARL